MPNEPTPPENHLGGSASSYLRSASHQPVHWFPWCEAAFARARAENKPVLLDVGAVWCHWCHVMDRESYERASTAALLNAHYICIKVDRDERPDIDTRYQAAVQAISGQGGWPLTAFLTPAGIPFFGGTYFPPDDRYGRPGFERVLHTMAHAFHDNPAEVEETAASIMAAIEQAELITGGEGTLTQSTLDKLTANILAQFDPRNGGFGAQPKFPHSTAVALLLDAAAHGNAEAAHAVAFTLRKMAAGGLHDQLAGGFHRYSVDERWVVPHFEKMAYDNAELLKNYANAFLTFGDELFRTTALRIAAWMERDLSDQPHGGFYASQDADASLEDDGDFFTWTRTEVETALTPAEFTLADAYFNLREVGDMHHNPQKNVLHLRNTATDPGGPSFDSFTVEGRGRIGTDISGERGTQNASMRTIRAKLLAARNTRPTPFIDRTVYTGWNAMCISAFLTAGRALNAPHLTAFALRSLTRALASSWQDSHLAHVVAYAPQNSSSRPEHRSLTAMRSGETPVFRPDQHEPLAEPLPANLEDHAFLATTCLDAYQQTGDLTHYEQSVAIAEAMCARFYDAETQAGFFDTEPDATALGALTVRRKPMQDAPTPAGNFVAADILLRLADLGAPAHFADRARATLASFAGVAEHFGLYAGTFALAAARALRGTTQITIVGADTLAAELEAAALRPFQAEKSVIRLRSLTAALPPALAETLPAVPLPGSFAFVCRHNTCAPPITNAEELQSTLRPPL